MNSDLVYIIKQLLLIKTIDLSFEDRKVEELNEKMQRIERYNTDEFSFIGNVINSEYIYVHINESKTFTSRHAKIENAIAEYLSKGCKLNTV